MSEIRFLRKNMGLTGKRLSEVMGVDNATISRWERDFQQPAKAHDHFIRLLHITEKRVSAENTQHARIMKYFNMTEKHGMQLCAILRSSAASDVYKRQIQWNALFGLLFVLT